MPTRDGGVIKRRVKSKGRMRPPRMIAILLLGLMSSIPSAEARSPDDTTPSSRPAGLAEKANPPAGPQAEDPRRRQLENEYHAAGSPADKVHASIALARFILVTQCAPHLDCLLAGRDDCGSELAELAKEALEFLDAASAQLDASESGLDDDRRIEFEERIDMLQAFAGAFKALAAPASGDADERSSLLDACSHLAIYLDDTNNGIVESARLWQGFAYRRAERFDRAIQVLRPVLTRPAFNRVGFHARLQRCLALSDLGRHVNALWLCSKVAGKAEAWFADEDEAARKGAAASARWTRVRLLNAWARDLRAAGQSERGEEAESEATRIAGMDGAPPPLDRLLAVGETIAGLPAWDPVRTDETPAATEKHVPTSEQDDSGGREPPSESPAHE